MTQVQRRTRDLQYLSHPLLQSFCVCRRCESRGKLVFRKPKRKIVPQARALLQILSIPLRSLGQAFRRGLSGGLKVGRKWRRSRKLGPSIGQSPRAGHHAPHSNINHMLPGLIFYWMRQRPVWVLTDFCTCMGPY